MKVFSSGFKSVFQCFRKMSSTDPDETGFWGVISDCLDLSHTNDREGFEKVKEGIKVKKNFSRDMSPIRCSQLS